ncbi:MAG: polyprenyl synthetase family protein [Clostridia bacterium]|nr:polyprenyl synthetase family protein [Clostridia bacterium]
MRTKTDIDILLDSYLPRVNSRVNDAMRYSLLGGGKRIRFNMVCNLADHFNAYDSNTEAMAVAVEMIHTYSLIHDDLPCMDDDDYRRGKPSCHRAFDFPTAVLAGDGLLNQAMRVLVSQPMSDSYANAVKYILDCSGAQGMVLGQEYDLEGTRDFESVTLLKTCRMFCASTVSVAIYLNLDTTTRQLLEQYAINYGYAFQLYDDVVDNRANESIVKAQINAYIDNAKDCLSQLGIHKGYYYDLFNLLDGTNHTNSTISGT